MGLPPPRRLPGPPPPPPQLKKRVNGSRPEARLSLLLLLGQDTPEQLTLWPDEVFSAGLIAPTIGAENFLLPLSAGTRRRSGWVPDKR